MSATTEPKLLSRRRPAAMVGCHPPIPTWRVILLILVLVPPELENLLARVTVGRRTATRAPHAVNAHALSVAPAGVGHVGRFSH
jgi:hypothetical protein